MSARRAGSLAVTVVVATVLAVLLVTWAASIGPHQVLRGDGPSRAEPTARPTAEESQSADDRDDDKADDHTQDDAKASPALGILALVLNLAVLVAAGYLAFRGGRWTFRVRRERRLRHLRDLAESEADLEILPGRAMTRELLADAAEQRRVLSVGEPRNAVVACWQRFEDQAASAGIERHPWETSAEFTLRVLDLADADGHAVAVLAGLYREARFSEHPVTEDDRAAALAALDSIHRTIGAPA